MSWAYPGLVLLLIGALVVGTVVGLVMGGSLRSLADLSFRWWPLAIIGLVLQFIPVHAHGWAVGLLIASYAVLVVFFAANIRMAGMPLIALGFVLNLLVIGVNGGMPVSDHALRVAYGSGYAEQRRELAVGEGGAKHHLQGRGDELTWLADEIPIPVPVRIVVSAGDLVSLVGAGWLMASATMGKAAPAAGSAAAAAGSAAAGGSSRGSKPASDGRSQDAAPSRPEEPIRPVSFGGRSLSDRPRRRTTDPVQPEARDEDGPAR
jgi:hypothetical protein